MTDRIAALAALVLEQTRARLAAAYGEEQASRETVEVIPGPKYTKINRNRAGFLMVENATGIIYGIQGYGRADKRSRYGTLDTAPDWYWGEYSPMDPAEYARWQAASADKEEPGG